MLTADATALGSLLASDFTLTHMTGHEQGRDEWLSDVRSGEMTYHSMQDVDVTVDPRGDDPVLTARTQTAATIWGFRGTWPLQLRIHFENVDGSWIASRTVASTWR